jgi:hypothetical protein
LEASGYAVNAAMMPINPSHVHIRIPTIGPSDGSATGTMSIQDDASLVTYESTQCSFSVQGGQMGVDVGKIWASSQCEYLSDLKTPGSNCQVDTGFFVFENCAN